MVITNNHIQYISKSICIELLKGHHGRHECLDRFSEIILCMYHQSCVHCTMIITEKLTSRPTYSSILIPSIKHHGRHQKCSRGEGQVRERSDLPYFQICTSVLFMQSISHYSLLSTVGEEEGGGALCAIITFNHCYQFICQHSPSAIEENSSLLLCCQIGQHIF